MTTPAPADQIHWLRSGVSYVAPPLLRGEVSRRGQTITLTAELLESNTDREGRCLFALSEAEQIAAYGEPVWAPGPATAESLIPVSRVERDAARAEAKRQARLLPDPAEQAARLREIQEIYGSEPSTQTSSWTPGDAERNAILEREGRR